MWAPSPAQTKKGSPYNIKASKRIGGSGGSLRKSIKQEGSFGFYLDEQGKGRGGIRAILFQKLWLLLESITKEGSSGFNQIHKDLLSLVFKRIGRAGSLAFVAKGLALKPILRHLSKIPILDLLQTVKKQLRMAAPLHRPTHLYIIEAPQFIFIIEDQGLCWTTPFGI